MDWLSFTLGFFAFPLVAVLSLGVYILVRKLLARQTSLADLHLTERSSTLSFSSRLIGEIGEGLDSETGPAAKAS